MVGIYLLAVALGYSRQSWRALTLAAIILLLWHPYELFQAGFQLSFIAVAGLLAFWTLVTKQQGWRGKITGLLLVTIFMQLITVPVVMHHFHRLTPYGFLGNLLAIPWVTMVSAPLGLLSLLGQTVHPDIGEWLLAAMSLSLEQLRYWIEWVAQLPGSWQRVSGPSLTGLGLCIGAAAWAAMIQERWWRFVIAMLAIAVLFLPKTSGIMDGWLHIAVLDVGQAQSVALRSPAGKWSIIDAGGVVTARFNIGESAISAYLWQHGVTKLQRIVISHPQADHMAGAKRLLRNFRVKNLWLGYFPLQEKEKQSYRELLEQAKKSAVQIRYFKHGEKLEEDGLTIEVLPPLLRSKKTELNNRSLVLLYRFGQHRFLFPGDLESDGEKWLLEQNVLSPVTLTIAPHHGSKSSSTLPFVQTTNPQHVLFSVGRNNRHKLPKPEIVHRWQQSGAEIWRTDLDGTLIFQSDGTTLHTPPKPRHYPDVH
jgi:competence protein ComEC